jgi:exodeoxyribonuclease V gamma subunit
MLPQVLTLPECEPLRQYLQDGTQIRAYQLATRIADLFDGYQMFRADWLQDWEAGLDQLRRAAGEPVPVPDDQRWQPVLWRAVTAWMQSSAHLAVRTCISALSLHYRMHRQGRMACRVASWCLVCRQCRSRPWKH